MGSMNRIASMTSATVPLQSKYVALSLIMHLFAPIELGILVWQDFQFACGVYPAHREFIENVRKEAEDNIIRLRHHPSLALFCGNNEGELRADRLCGDRTHADRSADYQQVLQWGGTFRPSSSLSSSPCIILTCADRCRRPPRSRSLRGHPAGDRRRAVRPPDPVSPRLAIWRRRLGHVRPDCR